MRRFAAVTTCSLAGWQRYGCRMVQTFNKFWSPDVPLVVYSEDVLPVATEPFPEWLTEFKIRHRGNPDAVGCGNGSYNYVRDCVRFAHKVAAVTDAALKLDEDVLIWLDADTLTHAPVTVEWLSSLAPEDAYIAWLDRTNLYPECGFYMLSLRHPAHEVVMGIWTDLYKSDHVLRMRETHDSVTLQRVIEHFDALGQIRTHSLSGDVGRRHPHPFVNSRLAEKMDHCKGPRKDFGRSHRSDLIPGTRTEAHWQ